MSLAYALLWLREALKRQSIAAGAHFELKSRRCYEAPRVLDVVECRRIGNNCRAAPDDHRENQLLPDSCIVYDLEGPIQSRAIL